MMGINRFKALHASSIATTVDLQEVIHIFQKSFKKCWNTGSIVAFDESVYAYQPKKKTKEKCDVVCYQLCS